MTCMRIVLDVLSLLAIASSGHFPGPVIDKTVDNTPDVSAPDATVFALLSNINDAVADVHPLVLIALTMLFVATNF